MLYSVTLQRADGRELVTEVRATSDETACAAAAAKCDPTAGYLPIRAIPVEWLR